MNGDLYRPAALGAAAFGEIVGLLHEASGIRLSPGKESMVQARLGRRLRELGLVSFEAYLERVRADRAEAERMVDVLTTNKTSFYRESAHFDFLVERGVPRWRERDQRVRIWSAGCSTGQEPYTVAMRLSGAIRDVAAWDLRVLATDISERVLAVARAAEYGQAELSDVPPAQQKAYFEPAGSRVRVRQIIREVVQFARLNLLGPWPMRGRFDAILCRNVMIYFDEPTRRALAERFCESLHPGGWLLIGHSESLGPSPRGLECLRPSLYERTR